jgi:histidinol-phosphate phosphatase family protein
MTDRAVFLDRDGTMAPDVHYCGRPEDFDLFPNTAKAVRLLNEHGFKVIVITNQSGIARGYFTEETLAEIHKKMKRELAKEGAWVDAIYYCPHHPDDNCDCRKPKPRLILQAAEDFDVDLERSFVMGDLQMDIDLGKAVGCPAILIRDGAVVDSTNAEASLIVPDLLEAARIVIDGELDKMCRERARGSASASC